ncbi:MAG: DUF1488 family protein [Alphaproteobacteria bacterium]
MTLNFPNPSRIYVAKKNQVQFWGHDGTLEVSFLVAGEALNSTSTGGADLFLGAFDTAREKIHAAVRRAYAHKHQGAYHLAAGDI